jgi:hypothetical protein
MTNDKARSEPYLFHPQTQNPLNLAVQYKISEMVENCISYGRKDP